MVNSGKLAKKNDPHPGTHDWGGVRAWALVLLKNHLFC